MGNFIQWLRVEVMKHWKWQGQPHEMTMRATVEAMRHGAERRVRSCLVQAMGAEKLYLQDATVHAAIDTIAAVAVAGMFGEIPLTAEEKNAKLGALEQMIGTMGGPSVLGTSWDQAMKPQAASVTKDDIVAALKQMPKPQSYQYVVHPSVKQAISDEGKKPMQAKKSGLPAAKTAKKEEDQALDDLWARVSKKSDELLGIKQSEKYAELVGLDPEEI
ncbi:MAG TPA: hypothetical protein VFI41_05080 [Gemmatimonadales bacterium]|nr:hypothetical protein [Gemmatimonadales bacterium]